MPARTLFDKIWDRHVVAEREGGQTLLYIDRHLCHDGSFNGFRQLRAAGRVVRRPGQTFATPDHYVPTDGTRPDAVAEPHAREILGEIGGNCADFGVTLFPWGDRRQGIVHVVGPEQGITLPGITLVCGDSHTSTHGALGCISFGIGASEVALVLATQCIWQRRPKTMRITLGGTLADGVTAKDLMIAIIRRIGADGGAGHAIEYAGQAVRALSVEARLTLCNMTIEAGSRFGLVAPDDVTFEYISGRPFAPQGQHWDRALALWRGLPSDGDAAFDRELAIDAGDVGPMVTWGNSPALAEPVTGRIPDPDREPDADTRREMVEALEYMDLRPGTPMTGIRVDRVFIGSCTNSRIEDLRAAAAVLRGRRAVVPILVSPGSGLVRAQAEAEGLDRIFAAAGAEWREPGCSMCVGMNGDRLAPGERCASTSNRNFRGRQGLGSRTHLVSPAMAAAAGIAGRFADVRRMGIG